MFIVITLLIMLNLVQALCAKEPVEFSYQPVSGSQYQQKISNFELQRLISRATPIPNYMIHMQRSIQQKVTNLKKNGLSEAGVNLVVGNNMLDYLNYKTSGLQANQLLRIINHINDLGQLKQTYANNHDLNVLCAESLNFTNFANNANRENLVVLSSQFLEIAKQLFSVAKGIGCGVYRNLASYGDMVLHPIDTACDLYHVATNIGIGIVRALNIYQKVCLAKLVKDPKLAARHQQDVGRYVNEWREFYDYHIQNFLDNTKYASKQDRCQFIGERVADIIFLIGGGEFLALSKAVVPWAQLASRPIKLASNFSRKIGQFGCQINRTVGTVIANGKKYVQRSNELKLATGKAGMIKDADSLLNYSANIMRQDLQITAGVSDTARLAKLAEFETGLISLTAKYGEKIVNDAKQAFKLTDYKIIKNGPQSAVNELGTLCSKIDKVFKEGSTYCDFIRDAAKGNSVTVGSVEEALVAIAAEKQGICKKLARALDPAFDFIDCDGIKWDIKSFYPKRIKPGRQMYEYVNNIKKDLDMGEFVLIDVIDATVSELENLKSELAVFNIDNKIKFIHRIDSIS